MNTTKIPPKHIHQAPRTSLRNLESASRLVSVSLSASFMKALAYLRRRVRGAPRRRERRGDRAGPRSRASAPRRAASCRPGRLRGRPRRRSLANHGGAGDAQVSTVSPLVSRSTADISARWNDDIGLSGCVHLRAERGCSTKPLTDVAALPVGDDLSLIHI